MKTLPIKYSWLATMNSPKMLAEMVKLYGVVETPGARDNPFILQMAKAIGLGGVYIHDAIAWCGLTVGYAAHMAGKTVVKDPLWALNWKNFGHSVLRPMLGDVMVKKRDGGGHVTMYIGEDDTHYHCLGGNQSDAVSIARYPKNDRWVSFNRPIWVIAQPAEVQIIHLTPDGTATGGSMA